MARAVGWTALLGLAAIAAALATGLSQAAADPGPPVRIDPPDALCLTCHSEDGIVVEESGGQRALDVVEADALAASAHAEERCISCHREQSAMPHPEPAASPADAAAASCAGCHADAYGSFLNTPHGTMVHLGDHRAPSCGSCHGGPHEIKPVAEWTDDDRAAACAECHDGAGPSFLDALGHQEPSPGFLPFAYFAGRFLVVLTALVLAFGIIHVELDILRWLSRRRRRGSHPEM